MEIKRDVRHCAPETGRATFRDYCRKVQGRVRKMTRRFGTSRREERDAPPSTGQSDTSQHRIEWHLLKAQA
jgi:hypothetical protein